MVAVKAEEDAVPKVLCPITFNVPEDERFVDEAFPNVLCPETESVPLLVKEEVAVMVPSVALPPVREEMSAVTEVSSVVKKLLEVAFVVVRFAIVPFVPYIVVAVSAVAEAVDSVV